MTHYSTKEIIKKFEDKFTQVEYTDTIPIIKRDASDQIMEMYETGEMESLLECTVAWMEENDLPLTKASVKYIPKPIIEKIKMEAIDENRLRPSNASMIRTATLEGFFE